MKARAVVPIAAEGGAGVGPGGVGVGAPAVKGRVGEVVCEVAIAWVAGALGGRA